MIEYLYSRPKDVGLEKLQPSTRHALARARDAHAKHALAMRSGDQLSIANAEREMRGMQAVLEGEKANESALAAMRVAMANPLAKG